jgi:hypothetical protein
MTVQGDEAGQKNTCVTAHQLKLKHVLSSSVRQARQQRAQGPWNWGTIARKLPRPSPGPQEHPEGQTRKRKKWQ